MNKTKIQNQINDLEKKLAELKEELNKPENKVFKPQLGEGYYYLTECGGVGYNVWGFGTYDINRYSIGNCYETDKEVYFEIERLKVIAELKRFAKEHNKPINWNNIRQAKYYISYRNDGQYVAAYFFTDIVKQNNIYFSSKELAEKAVKEIGEDRIKKYYLMVE